MAEASTLRKHCKLYLQILRAWEGKGIHPYYVHRRALAAADKAYRLTAEERQRRDREWLDRDYPDRLREPEPDKPKGLFDDSVMRVE